MINLGFFSQLIFIVSFVLKFRSRHKGDNRRVSFCLIIFIFPHEVICRAICISRLFKVAKPHIPELLPWLF